MENQEKPSPELLNAWHDDPKNWKLGLLYFNKDDKRIFPPKRTISMGWTINFANPISILTFVVFLGIVIALVTYLKTLG